MKPAGGNIVAALPSGYSRDYPMHKKRVRDANARAFKVFNGFEREGKIVPGELEGLKQRFDKAGGASELGMSFTNFKNMYKGPYYLGTKYSVSGKKK